MEITVASILIGGSTLTLIVFLYKWLFSHLNYWKSRGVPCVPGALPFCGNTLSVLTLRDNMATWGRKVYLKYRGKASMIGFFNMSTPTLMIIDPEVIKVVLQTSFKSFEDNEHTVDPKMDPLVAGDTFFLRGQPWRDFRAVFVTTLSIKRVKIMSDSVVKTCEKLRDFMKRKISNGESKEEPRAITLETKDLFSRYTSDMAASTIFGIDGRSFDLEANDTLYDSMKWWFGPSTNHAITFVLSLSPLGKFVRTSFVPPKMDSYFRQLSKDVEELIKRKEISSNNVFGMMMDLVNDGKISYTDALSHAFAFLIEIYETSSLTLSFVCYVLSKNQNVQEETRREINIVLDKYNGCLSYEAIQELNYTERVVNETLRLFPPLGYLAKVAVEEHRLIGSDGINVKVEPGTSILIPAMGLHEDPDIWENPQIFDPQRFTKDNIERRHKCVYLPFGDGPRACPGTRLAYAQIKAAIATVLRDYRIDLSPKMIDPLIIEPSYFLNTARGGFFINFTPLKKQR